MANLKQLWEFIIAWYNLPFTIALLLFTALAMMQFFGLDQDPEAEFDADLDADADLDFDADADFDADLDADADFDADADTDADLDAGDLSLAGQLLEFLGVGKAPVTMILLLLLGSFGVIGWIANSVLLNLLGRYPVPAIAPVTVISLYAGGFFTSRTAQVIGRLVPAVATSATSKHRLVGRLGRVISPQVDQTFGLVKVRDSGGTPITVFAVIDPDQAPIRRDANVFLVEYNPVKKIFVVVSSS